MAKVVIEVSGGVVQAVYADDPGTKVVLVDWDNIEAGDAVDGYYPTTPLSAMPDETAEHARGADPPVPETVLPVPPGDWFGTFVFHGPGTGDVWWVNAPNVEAAQAFIHTKPGLNSETPFELSRPATTAADGVDAVVDAQGRALWESPTAVWHDYADGCVDPPGTKSFRFVEDTGLPAALVPEFEESTAALDVTWLVNAPNAVAVSLFCAERGLRAGPTGITALGRKWFPGEGTQGEGVDVVVDADGRVLWAHPDCRAKLKL